MALASTTLSVVVVMGLCEVDQIAAFAEDSASGIIAAAISRTVTGAKLIDVIDIAIDTQVLFPSTDSLKLCRQGHEWPIRRVLFSSHEKYSRFARGCRILRVDGQQGVRIDDLMTKDEFCDRRGSAPKVFKTEGKINGRRSGSHLQGGAKSGNLHVCALNSAVGFILPQGNIGKDSSGYDQKKRKDRDRIKPCPPH